MASASSSVIWSSRGQLRSSSPAHTSAPSMLLLAADHRRFSIPPSASVPLLTSGIPPACKGLPPLVCQADSLQPNQLMEQLSEKLFNCSSSSDTTSAAQLTFMRHFVSELIVPVKHRQPFSMGKRRKGGAKHRFPLEQVSTHRCSINKWRINKLILQPVECLPGRSQEFHNVNHLLTSSGPRTSRLCGGLSYRNHHQVLRRECRRQRVTHQDCDHCLNRSASELPKDLERLNWTI